MHPWHLMLTSHLCTLSPIKLCRYFENKNQHLSKIHSTDALQMKNIEIAEKNRDKLQRQGKGIVGSIGRPPRGPHPWSRRARQEKEKRKESIVKAKAAIKRGQEEHEQIQEVLKTLPATMNVEVRNMTSQRGAQALPLISCR